MKVSDLLTPSAKNFLPNQPAAGMGYNQEVEVKPSEASLYTLTLIADPSEVEILDGKLVFTKRIVAWSKRGAIDRLNIQVS